MNNALLLWANYNSYITFIWPATHGFPRANQCNVKTQHNGEVHFNDYRLSFFKKKEIVPDKDLYVLNTEY